MHIGRRIDITGVLFATALLAVCIFYGLVTYRQVPHPVAFLASRAYIYASATLVFAALAFLSALRLDSGQGASSLDDKRSGRIVVFRRVIGLSLLVIAAVELYFLRGGAGD